MSELNNKCVELLDEEASKIDGETKKGLPDLHAEMEGKIQKGELWECWSVLADIESQDGGETKRRATEESDYSIKAKKEKVEEEKKTRISLDKIAKANAKLANERKVEAQLDADVALLQSESVDVKAMNPKEISVKAARLRRITANKTEKAKTLEEEKHSDHQKPVAKEDDVDQIMKRFGLVDDEILGKAEQKKIPKNASAGDVARNVGAFEGIAEEEAVQEAVGMKSKKLGKKGKKLAKALLEKEDRKAREDLYRTRYRQEGANREAELMRKASEEEYRRREWAAEQEASIAERDKRAMNAGSAGDGEFVHPGTLPIDELMKQFD
jgi:hypothetical protein